MKTKHSMTIYFVIAFAPLMLAIGTAAAEPGTETQIITDGSDQSDPDIYGDRIVWMDSRNGNYDIYMYDISTGGETQIITDGYYKSDPDIYGDRIVWMDSRNPKYDIYMYDISTGVETQITTDGSYQWNPAIYGDRIVWQDDRNGNYDIYMYDISTEVETQITTNVSDQSNPAIYGDRIVWMDWRNGNYDIYMYDISTGVETQITTNGSRQLNVAIYDDRIVWMDSRNGHLNWDIYMYDISTGVETQITTNVSDQYDPAIYGDRIVWQDLRNGNWDIYMFTLDSSVDYPPIANAGSDTTVTIGLPVTFDGSGSTDDNGVVSYSWDFDASNGITSESTSITPTKTYATIGTYTVTLTVTDTSGQKSSDKMRVTVSSPTSTVSYAPLYDNRLRESSPSTVLSTTSYIDVGRTTANFRDVMLFDLSSYKTTDTISKATLSLYWYYPAGATRTSDTIVEIYRPLDWDPRYVTWNARLSGTLWSTAGGNWFDKNGVAQGVTPYASLTFAGSKVPDNRYYDFDVTQLVQEYVSGKYKNTGFFLKAKTESGNYIAFYSSEWTNAAQRPKLTVTAGTNAVDNPPVANAGADKTATVGSAVTFDASASTDDKTTASYSWDFDASNGIAVDATTKTASRTYTAVGTYTVTLTVTDTIGQKSTDTLQVVVSAVTPPTSTVSYTPTSDNRLKESSATTVLPTTGYIDVGRTTANFRDVMLFDLSSYKTTDTISKATLSLYWYYPAGKTRTSDTVVEIYRPLDWDPQYVTWNARLSGTLWSTAGGNWFDKNGVAQGATPYASLTFAGSKVPDNKYYDFDVTQLVQEYVSDKYKNTGFFLKAKTESGNYIAFYSSEWTNAAQRPKLTITR